jgi:hypothetical protein
VTRLLDGRHHPPLTTDVDLDAPRQSTQAQANANRMRDGCRLSPGRHRLGARVVPQGNRYRNELERVGESAGAARVVPQGIVNRLGEVSAGAIVHRQAHHRRRRWAGRSMARTATMMSSLKLGARPSRGTMNHGCSSCCCSTYDGVSARRRPHSTAPAPD